MVSLQDYHILEGKYKNLLIENAELKATIINQQSEIDDGVILTVKERKYYESVLDHKNNKIANLEVVKPITNDKILKTLDDYSCSLECPNCKKHINNIIVSENYKQIADEILNDKE